jgi:hypothetical protein
MRNYDLRNRSDVVDLHAELETALRVALEGSNVRLPSGGRLGYDPITGEVTFKIKLRVDRQQADGTVEPSEALVFKRMAILDGVPLDMLNTVISMAGVSYRVVGAVSRRSEKTYMIQRVRDGKAFVCSAKALLAARRTVSVTA